MTMIIRRTNKPVNVTDAMLSSIKHDIDSIPQNDISFDELRHLKPLYATLTDGEIHHLVNTTTYTVIMEV